MDPRKLVLKIGSDVLKCSFVGREDEMAADP
jgi:hypothetical protein